MKSILRTLEAVAALALMASPVFAAPAANWAVDPAASRLGFKGVMSGDGFEGSFRRWQAKIAFDPKNLPGSKVSVSVDVASAATGDADRDQALPTGDWFAAAAHPQALFAANTFKDLGGGKYQAVGTLTIRGVTQPIVLPFTLAITGDTARVNGAVSLNRTAFGIGQGQWQTGAVVAIPVTVTLALTAHRTH